MWVRMLVERRAERVLEEFYTRGKACTWEFLNKARIREASHNSTEPMSCAEPLPGPMFYREVCLF